MNSPLTAAGAISEPSRSAPLHTNRFFTGLWTHRNPLRDAATPFLTEKFYGGTRFDSLIDGLNTEVTSRLTMARRYGHSVYNSQTFPAINRFYQFNIFGGAAQIIKVIADTATQVYDATGPNTKTLLFTKSAGAGSSYFQSVGNILYFGNGKDQKKWVQTAKAWAAATQFQAGDYLVDPSNNLQLCVGLRSANISTIAINANVLTIVFTGNITFLPGMNLALAGFTTSVFLNGQTVPVLSVTQNTLTATFVHANVGTTADTGTASTANGLTGGVQPAWAAVVNAVTIDNNQQWICRGSSVQNWGGDAPANALSVANATRPSLYPNWAINTFYSPSLAIVDSNNNMQLLTTSGTLGGGAPAWNVAYNGTTADNTAVWTNKGSKNWAAAHAYALGDLVSITFTYYVTTFRSLKNGEYQVETTTAVTVTDTFQVTKAGLSGAASPHWVDGVGQLVTDNTVTWTCLGKSQVWTDLGAAAVVSNATAVIDTNGNIQNVSVPGKSGAVAPTWKTINGQTTVDNTVSWVNGGPFSAAGTAQWFYSYAFRNTITNEVTTAAPLSDPIIVAAGMLISVQGQGSADTQFDVIDIYRTAQGGSLLLLLDQIANPGAVNWTYNDGNFDDSLNELIPAQIASSSNPPPVGLINLEYHLGRIFGSVGNTLYYSAGPDIINGNGNSCFPPLNNFTFPSAVTRTWSTPIGLLVFTLSHIYIVLGQGTVLSGFYPVKFLEGIGLSGYDAFTVNGTTAHLMTTAKKVISIDPGAGVIENGFPIGDKFKSDYSPTTAFLTWHEGSSDDTALFAADGSTGWYRMASNPAPESGIVWSPKAQVIGGCKAVMSLETAPGIKTLLVGPSGSGQILQRDSTVNRDNGVSFTASFTIGSIVLAQPGAVAELEFITVDATKVGSIPLLGLLLDEISGTFDALYWNRGDPPVLPPSNTLYAVRYWCSQNQGTTFCRHFQLRFDFAAEDARNEILAYTIFGAVHQEKR